MKRTIGDGSLERHLGRKFRVDDLLQAKAIPTALLATRRQTPIADKRCWGTTAKWPSPSFHGSFGLLRQAFATTAASESANAL